MNPWLWIAGMFLLVPVSGADPAPVEVTRGFEELWTEIRARSPELQARAAKVLAAEDAAGRAALHWTPRLFLEGRVYATDDPGLVFFSKLSQRRIEASDFVTASLNTPGMNSFVSAGVGADLPLWEGGSRSAASRAERRILESERIERGLAEVEAHAATARDYARFLSLEGSLERLRDLRARLLGVLDRYSVGREGNPVGYSGLLGLKGLRNRVEASLRELEAERSTLRVSFGMRAGLESADWRPEPVPLPEFLDQRLPLRSVSGPGGRERSAHLRSDAQAEWKRAEEGRFLPRVGLFGNGNLVSGSRATGTNATVGLYLHWNLLDPDLIGRVSEGSHREEAARAMAEGTVLERRISDQSLQAAETALRGNRGLLIESEGILSEQTRVAFRLFQSGAMPALQLAEVLNRRIDLVLNLKSLEAQWIQVRTDARKNADPERGT